MNNIVINNEDFVIENQNCKIDIKVSKLNLKIKGNVSINNFNLNQDLELNITVEKNSTLNYYMFSNNNFTNKSIKIDNYSNSKTNFNYSFINDEDCKVVINNNILEDNIHSDIKVRGVCFKNSNSIIDSNGYVKEDTLNNEFNEDLRGLNLENGFIKINPNMYIDSNDVIANHNTTIGNINKDYLFYLNSKGIEDKQATNLIINGFIKSILNEYMNDIIESQK
jgi:Fe-S cluster assembly protein SufD